MNLLRYTLLGLLIALFFTNSYSQTEPFNVSIEPVSIDGLFGLQAYSVGQSGGRWLIVGGRLDGLHRMQPFSSFDVAGNNNQIIVVDPVSKQLWKAPISSLSVSLQEQLSSTNMEYRQEGNYLYILGGYGYNVVSATRKTFDYLTAINVPALIDAVINGTAISDNFRQISDPLFAVTGGHLEMINSTYYLIGGNKFDGNYNPMGNPSYTQEYTNAIRKFDIDDDGTNITVTHLPSFIDPINLHRRDYNAAPQISTDGSEGITAFSGVFQIDANLPFLNCVNIDSSNYYVNNDFQQYYNHYHCPVLPMYSAKSNEMHTVFFGGIAQYYDSLGTLVQDDNVPFVKTIARVTRDATGAMAEYKMPTEMPDFLGAGAEFIPISDVPRYDNSVLKIDEFVEDSTLVGYIYGGIQSSAPNIFFNNSGSNSVASTNIFKVYVIKNSTVGIHQLNSQSKGSLKMQIFPNPSIGEIAVKFNLNKAASTQIIINTLEGKVIEEKTLENLSIGEHIYKTKFDDANYSGAYILTIKTAYETATQKVILQK